MNSVTITLNDDGTYTVEQEPSQDSDMGVPEGPENGQADMQEDAAEGEPSQQFQSAEEACQAAVAMLGGSGESAEPKIDGEDAFVNGFKGARGIEQGF